MQPGLRCSKQLIFVTSSRKLLIKFARDNLSGKIAFNSNGRMGGAAQHYNLSDVCQSIGNRTLCDFLYRLTERRV